MTDVSPAGVTPRLIAVTSAKSVVASLQAGPSWISQRLSPWLSALQVLVTMLRNVLMSTVVAWAVAFLTSRGNFFSATPAHQQSHAMFLASCLVITNVTSSLNYWCVATTRWRFDRRALAGTQKRSSLLAFALRVVRGSAFHCALSTAFTIILAAVMGSSWFPGSLASARLDFYGAVFGNHYVFVAMDVVARRINRQETMKTLDRIQQHQSVPCTYRPRNRIASVRQVMRAYVRTAPFILSVFVAGVYVQVTSRWVFATTSSFASDAFVVASLALKILVQEIAKRYLEYRKVRQLHVMCVFVSLPTVLIDTQVRVVILSLNDSQSTLTRTYAMSLLEIFLRLCRVLILRRTIRRKMLLIQREATSIGVNDTTNSPRFGSCANYEQWRKQQTDLHTAETFADMYAEYIAIGCSAAITFFFGNDNPHYSLGENEGDLAHTGLAWTLVIQIVVEAVTDYVSCVMEMYLGQIDGTHEVSRLGAFLGVLSVMYAVVNVHMSAVLYLKPW